MDDEHCYDMELENRVKVGYTKLGVEEEAEIQSAVRILLQGLGEDINRDGIQKTPLRVAKALRHATKGESHFLIIFVTLICASPHPH